MSPVTLIDAPLPLMRCPLPSFLSFHQHLCQPPILVSGHHRIEGMHSCIIGSKAPHPTPSLSLYVLLQAVTCDCLFQFQLKPSNTRPASPPSGGISKTLSPTLSRKTPARVSLRKSPSTAAMSPSSPLKTPIEPCRTPKRSSRQTPPTVHLNASITATPKAKSPASATKSPPKVSPSITKQSGTDSSPPRRSPSSKAGASHNDGSTPFHACCRRRSADDAGRRC